MRAPVGSVLALAALLFSSGCTGADQTTGIDRAPEARTSSADPRSPSVESRSPSVEERAFYPKSPRARRGIGYPFLLSQCDLMGFVDFDGSFWLPLENVKEAGLPRRHAMPFLYRGSMTLVNDDKSVFRAGEGRLPFERQDGPTYAASRSCF